jgi:putative ABC transport system substrate-binding protein
MENRRQTSAVRNQKLISSFGVLISCLSAMLFAFCSPAEAQQPSRVPRIGFVDSGSPKITGHRADAFARGLKELGYIEGRSITIQYLWAEGNLERFPAFIKEVVDAKVDVIVSSATPAIRAAQEKTSTIPIVMAGVTDPVGNGFVASLARPGKNITGLTHVAPDLTGKRLELIKEVMPRLSRVGVIWNPNQPGQEIAFKEMQAAARAWKLNVNSMEARNRGEIEKVLSGSAKDQSQALLELPDPLLFVNRELIAVLAAKRRLPTMYSFSEYVEAGGLMSYGTSFPGLFHRAATYVDKILKGAKPADLPVEQPTKFELVINLKTAKQIGLTIPPNVLVRANRVIR